MPRLNPQRSIASEHTLARRIAHEREKRGWSYEGLAGRMESVGCPINASGLYKSEKLGRRITVDELVGLSRVFGVEVGALLRPPEDVLTEEMMTLLVNLTKALAQTLEADAAYKKAIRDVAWFLDEHPTQVGVLDRDTLLGTVETLRDIDTEEDHRLADRLERIARG